MLPADLDAHMATRSTTSPPTSWPAWAQRRSALCRRALSSDTASSSDKPEQRRRRCVAADRPAQIVSSSHPVGLRSEEHTSELQSLMRISYAVFCLKKKKQRTN